MMMSTKPIVPIVISEMFCCIEKQSSHLPVRSAMEDRQCGAQCASCVRRPFIDHITPPPDKIVPAGTTSSEHES